MKEIIYKCMKCGYKFFDNRDGIRCPVCRGGLIHMPPPKEWMKENKVNISGERIVTLKRNIPMRDEMIDKLEEKLSQKFGCKVIILDHGLEFDADIDG